MKQINSLAEARERITQLREAAKSRYIEGNFGNGKKAGFGKVGDDGLSFVDKYGIFHSFDPQTNALIPKEIILHAFDAIPKTSFNDLLMVEEQYSVGVTEEGKQVVFIENGDNVETVAEIDPRRGLDAWKTISGTHYMVKRKDGGMSCVKDVYAARFEHPIWGDMCIGDDGRVYQGVRNSYINQTIGLPIGESCKGQRNVRINHDLEARACETARRGYDPVFMRAARSLFERTFGKIKTAGVKRQPQMAV